MGSKGRGVGPWGPREPLCTASRSRKEMERLGRLALRSCWESRGLWAVRMPPAVFVVFGNYQALKVTPHRVTPITVTVSVSANPGNSELMKVDHGLNWNQRMVSWNKQDASNWMRRLEP